MKIRIKDNARKLYVETQNCQRQPTNWTWAETLSKVEGKVLDVETDWLHSYHYNTTSIEGVSSNGLRIMDQSVAEVIDDVRGNMQRCRWCGKPSLKRGSICVHCNTEGYLSPFVLSNLR